MSFRIALLFVVLMYCAKSTSACDACGGGSANMQLGILPMFYKHYVGIQYINRHFDSYKMSGSDKRLNSSEHLNTIELRGRYSINKKWQLFAFVPYMLNRQQMSCLTSQINGVGDAIISANRVVLKKAQGSWQHLIQAGVGIKMPTGKYKTYGANLILNPFIQAGTGSYDALLNALVVSRYKKFGLSNFMLQRLNGKNSRNYHFGNLSSLQTTAFYEWNRSDVTILPNVGLAFDYKQADAHGNLVIKEVATSTINTSAGCDVYYKQMALQLNAQMPVMQKSELIKALPRYSVTMLYNF